MLRRRGKADGYPPSPAGPFAASQDCTIRRTDNVRRRTSGRTGWYCRFGSADQSIQNRRRRDGRRAATDKVRLFCTDEPRLRQNTLFLLGRPQQRGQRRSMPDAENVRRPKSGHDLGGESRQLQVAAEPALRDLQTFGHPLLAAAVVAVDSAGIITGTLKI